MSGDPTTPSVPSTDLPADDYPLLGWQSRLLPFMIGSLIVVALCFIASTLWFFHDLEQRLEYRTTDITAVVDRLAPPADAKQSDQAYRDWYVRAVLEGVALQQRFNVQATVVKGRLWTRFMGFLTGMLLALTGCVFVLGKLRETVSFGGEGQGFKATLATSSPGVFLAFLGTVIIGIALVVQTTVESSDTAVYLSRQVQEVPAPPAPVRERPAPAALAAPEAAGATRTAPGVPPSVLEHAAEAGKAHSSASGK